ncbi:cytochrome bc1 complex cytochrome b subunit, partial [Streptosporangium roseum]
MSTGNVPKPIASTSSFIDDRIGAGNFLKRNLRKVFPDHWSFLLGEIALYSFIVLLLTGTFLTFFFKPTMAHVVYDGSYEPLKGVMMSEAYASALHISFDVRGGLLMRQMHHWAALLFVAGMMVHALRVFFTGAYRKPRELNWLIGVGLLTLALAEGLTGYSLPDDLLSGAGLRITEGVAISLPLVGTWITFFLFGGEYPGEDVVSRFYSLHILLIPGILLALITAHMILMWVQKHTQMPGKGRTNTNVVGAPFYPAFMAKAGAYFMFTFGAIALLGTFAQINPIWLFGPYTPADISAGSQPDFYMGFLEGSLRLMPAWEINFL